MINWEDHPRYFLENAFKFIDQEFEWSYDADASLLYLQIPPDQDITELQIYIPISEGIIELHGTPENSLKNVHFENLKFKYSAWQNTWRRLRWHSGDAL